MSVFDDGRLYNPHSYPEDIVRKLVEDTERVRAERRSAAAKRAGVTRAKRQQLLVHQAGRRILENNPVGPLDHCFICGKALIDPPSIERGIGPECWDHVLAAIQHERERRLASV